MSADLGPFLSEFAAWLDAGHGTPTRRPGHVRDVNDFLTWYDVNHRDDIATAARSFAQCGTTSQQASMRLLLRWLGGDR